MTLNTAYGFITFDKVQCLHIWTDLLQEPLHDIHIYIWFLHARFTFAKIVQYWIRHETNGLFH